MINLMNNDDFKMENLPVYIPYFSDLRPTLCERSYFAQKHEYITYTLKYIKSVLFAYTCDLKCGKTHFEVACFFFKTLSVELRWSSPIFDRIPIVLYKIEY